MERTAHRRSSSSVSQSAVRKHSLPSAPSRSDASSASADASPSGRSLQQDLLASAFSVAATLVLSAVPVVASAAAAPLSPLVPPVATIAAVAASIAVTYTITGSASSDSGHHGSDAQDDVLAASGVLAKASAGNEAAPQGSRPAREEVRVAGFLVGVSQLPEEANSEDIGALVARTRESCPEVPLSQQRALRLLLGCDLDLGAALEKAREVEDWRRERDLARTRETLQRELRGKGQVSFPYSEDVSRLVVVNPCAAVSSDGCPVTVWHVGTASTSASVGRIPSENLEAWSRAVFEYVDLWISDRSERTGRLAGHIQVFNLHGLSFWHVANVTLAEKLKKVFGAAEYYVESTSHIYVVNASHLFSMAWKAVQGLVGPRTASKITVAAEAMPADLLAELGPASAARLSSLLEEPRADAPLLQPGQRP